ncbi:multisubunit sodium/proton antiporter, MrpF subunit [Austwickia chelonae]|uniref:Na(+)/H(+) antiporter subunit F n=1 Tax=Austwickia chelonae NBRC 105200 TaxID=1184607 RepID=K6V9I2_9MICO|nr:monovalent cation/H+ antiporter complex subunit F [Austwickia chelonae]GAB78893.1 Na(+)/H(+) antiporter subunit F [Austwickia chelonae NBRC 105200]SEV86031.1 multisubunit sodium/proton antiporter, MrpF subunit [Austwickia chelonae]
MIETVVIWVIGAMLVSAAVLAVVRIVRGPTVIDRAVANEVLVAIMVCALGVEAATTRHDTTLPILISLSLTGFLASVSIARFVGRDRDRRPAGSPDSGDESGPGVVR